MTESEFQAIGVERFGAEPMKFQFVCPSCGYVATPEDYKAAGAPETAVGFSCIGRWLPGDYDKNTFTNNGGPCTYAGGGLIGLNPIVLSDRKSRYFDFAPMKLVAATLLLIIAFCSIAAAQVHVAANIGASNGLGFSNPTYGISGGFERNKKIGFSIEGSLDKIRKLTGGPGYQATGRETVRAFKDRFFVQGGAVESHYAVTKFSKSSFAPLIGIGYANKGTVLEANFRAETNANHARTVEARATFYLQHHVFFRVAGIADRFRQGKDHLWGGAVQVSVGYWR